MPETVTRIPALRSFDWPASAVFVCDRRVERALGPQLADRTILVEGGESLKTLTSIEDLAEHVLALRATRPLILVGVGGGSVGDAVGFLASILWRGVELWHVPTTLLAAVDSAHGGKTAVNLGSRKNQLGTFWPAERVILAEDVFADLPRELRLEGMAELVKALWLGGESLDDLDDAGVARLALHPWTRVNDALMNLVDVAIDVKRRIVARDPHEEHGIRTWLNFGHTVAHAVELSDQLSHGVAVAWGIAAAAILSHGRGLLETADRDRLLSHVYPLLGTRAPRPTRDEFETTVGRDKKRERGKLRSVLLRAPGRPVVVDDVTAADWYASLGEARSVFDAPIRVALDEPVETRLRIEASKSELNRMLAIAALRAGETSVTGESSADDVRHMRGGLAAIAAGDTTAEAGDGGTTFRFLVAVAAAGSRPVQITIGEQLASRPHDELFDALGRAGGVIERVSEHEFVVHPLPTGSVEFVVAAENSSQFASALALIAASGRRVNLRVSTRLVSRGYFEMTLSLLQRAGVRVDRDGRNYRLTPSDELARPVQLDASPDASSGAVWRVLQRLGIPVDVDAPAVDSRQPDSRLHEILWEVDDVGPVEVDLEGAPDLVGVLAAYGALTMPEVRLVNAPHLRFKESNRIDQLVQAFEAVGVTVEALDDGVALPPGPQSPRASGLFPTYGDHRLAMAGLILSTAAELEIDTPRVVNKSYPRLWLDASTAGWNIQPVSKNRSERRNENDF